MTSLLSKIQNPSKWDIIPIHTSDRSAFKFCRRQWFWSSPAKSNLVRKTSVHGIYEPFWFGGGIHLALQKYYDPVLQEDPATTWEAWFDLEWNGGLITENQLKEYIDRNPKLAAIKADIPGNAASGDLYAIDGLKEILPFADNAETVEKFMKYRDLGRGMMEFYKQWAEQELNANFTVIDVEHEFSVPVLDPQGQPLYMVDNRTMPDEWLEKFENRTVPENMYGPLWKMMANPLRPEFDLVKQVHARGRQDMILQEHEHGRYGIRDYKTTAHIDEDYFRHLELDEQCSTYLSCGEVEAQMYDLPYKKLEFIQYMALFKGYPTVPTITSRGYPSLDRSKESTTASIFEAVVQELSKTDISVKFWFENDQKAQSYYQWLLEMGDKRFIWPEEVWRNSTQRKNALLRLYYEALDMLNPELKLYPNPTKSYGCLNCFFRVPCILAETGGDYESVIEEGFMPNWDR